jgi:hypothetical protein
MAYKTEDILNTLKRYYPFPVGETGKVRLKIQSSYKLKIDSKNFLRTSLKEDYSKNVLPDELDEFITADQLVDGDVFVLQSKLDGKVRGIKKSDIISAEGLSIDLSDKLTGDGFFGDGSDGDVVIATNTTQSRDMFYRNLTIPLGYIFYTNGFRLFVQQTLTLYGTIDCSGSKGGDGGNASSVAAGAAGAAGTGTTTNYLPGGTNGTNGESGAIDPANGDAAAMSNAIISNSKAGALGGRGGAGFVGGMGLPSRVGAASVITSLSANYGKQPSFLGSLIGRVFGSASVLRYNLNGANGGSGNGGRSYSGWGGGGGASGGNGGMMDIFAKTIIGSGNICANGGPGGKGGTGSAGWTIYPSSYRAEGGGGAGGGGTGGNAGFIFIVSLHMINFTGNITAIGGVGGTGGAGGNGGNGQYASPAYPGQAGGAGCFGNGGDGGAGGLIVIYTNTFYPITFNYSVNDGNGGDGGGSQNSDSYGGCRLTVDNGANWTTIETGLTNTFINSLAYKNTSIYAAALKDIYLSTNTGTSWTKIDGGQIGSNINKLYTDATGIWAITNGSGVYLSTDNGATWVAKNNGLPDGLSGRSVVSITSSGSNIFISTLAGLYKSTDSGNTWTYVSTLLYNSASVVFYSGSNLFVGGMGSSSQYDGVWLSTDDGATWTQKSTGLSSPVITSFAVIGSNLFAGDAIQGVWLSTNNGTSWSHTTGMGGGAVNAFAVISTRLFVATDGGVYTTIDNGNTWTQVNTGLPGSASTHTLLAYGTDVLAGVYGYHSAIGGLGGGGSDGAGGVSKGQNGDGGNSGNGGNGYIGGLAGLAGISPPTNTYNTHGTDGTNGINGTSTGNAGVALLIQI